MCKTIIVLTPVLILGVVLAYFLVLLAIAFYTARGANNETFFIGKKNSKWYLVAYGMIGTSLSGVTFMSVPGAVGKANFSYMQVVLGYIIGYMVIAFVLLPLYYRLNLTSIYTYLQSRFGNVTYKTGAAFFLISRLLGASIRIFLVLNVLQVFMLDKWSIPFPVTVFLILAMILLYTFQGGVKTIVWTDTLQTTFMLLALVITVVIIANEMHLSFGQLYDGITQKGYSKIAITDWRDKGFFLKQIISGMLITITMTGLDQEMMQKNISIKTLGHAQKNMVVFSFTLLFVNALFLFLGGILYLFLAAKNIPVPKLSDNVFPTIAINYLPPVAALTFVIGLISALFPSADGAITALTSSICIDVLDFKSRSAWDEEKKARVRRMVQLVVAAAFLLVIVVFRIINDKSVIDATLTIAGYTYGPLLGLFSFGIFTRRQLNGNWVPLVCILSPVITYLLNTYSVQLFWGYQMGFELLLVNGLLTFAGLSIISTPGNTTYFNNTPTFSN